MLAGAGRPGNRRESLLGRDDAVSPVVGTILVLGISTVGIFAVMYWGVPAMTEVQDRTSFDAVLKQYGALDGAIENVVRGGTPDKATTVQLSVPGGTLEWNEGTRIAIELYYNHSGNDVNVDFLFESWEERDPEIRLTNLGEDLEDASLALLNHASPIPEELTLDAGAWPSGLDYTFQLPLPLYDHVLSIQVKDEGVLLYEAWVLDMGQLRWEFLSSLSHLQLTEENAGTLTNQSGSYWLHTRPLWQDEPYATAPQYQERFTVYLVQLVRDYSIGYPGVEGSGTYKVLVALEDNWLRSANVELLRFDLRVHGPWEGAWMTYFQESLGFPALPTGDGVTYQGTVQYPVRFALFHSRVATTILPSNVLIDDEGEVLAQTQPAPTPPPPPNWGSGASQCTWQGTPPRPRCVWN